jgi:hypothetical protein
MLLEGLTKLITLVEGLVSRPVNCISAAYKPLSRQAHGLVCESSLADESGYAV